LKVTTQYLLTTNKIFEIIFLALIIVEFKCSIKLN
jgi:hypothetical protein